MTTATAPASPRLHTRIAPSRSWAWPDLGELWRFRELMFTLAGRDLKVRYKQTALGVVWVVFQPLAAALIFTALRFFFRLPNPGNVPGVLFVLPGYVGWTLFKDVLGKSSTSLVDNGGLVSKIYFPRALLPLGTTISSGFDHLVSLAMFALVWAACGLLFGPVGFGDPAAVVPPPGLHLLLWPLATLLLVALALGVGMVATAVASHYRDVRHVLPVIVQLAFFISPVFYDLEQAVGPETPEWGRLLYLANPIAGLVPAYRWSLVGVGTVDWFAFSYAAAFSIVMLAVGLLVFRRVEGGVADVI